jgi:endonuclease/exonuclease/phosphatase family metal-dependent hydrolase
MRSTDCTRARTRIGAAASAAALAALLVVLIASASALSGCGSQPVEGPGAAASAPRTLTVMVFNIEYGGTQVSFRKIAEAVKKASPDVVGLEEAETNTARLARLAGYPYYNAGLQIVSRYPILEPSGARGVYAFIEVQPGYVVAISNVHLPSDPYGPNWIRDGKSADQVLALEKRLRLPAVQQQVQVLPKLAAQGIPVFVTGDFNEPSHLDYTQAAVRSRPQVKYALDWPVSRALANAGFKDSYRTAHPDPVKDPGLTWWAARPKVPGWNPTAKDPQDRIDFVYSAGPSKVLRSEIVGEQGNPAASVTVSPWPSDHRAVVSTFAVVPGAMPVLVATNRLLVRKGRPLIVTFHSPGLGGEKIWIALAGPFPGDTGGPGPIDVQRAGMTGTINGTATFQTGDLKPGAYQVTLAAADGKVLARTPFWVGPKDGRVRLATDKSSYRRGEPIGVSWASAPANRWDWIGVYRASAADPSTDYYLIWQYTGGAESGTVHGMPAGALSMDGATTEGSPWPLPPGKYVAYYLLADAYTAVARASFTVTK